MATNEEIYEFLKKISFYHYLEDDAARAGSFRRAAEAIRMYKGDYFKDFEKVKIYGIGNSTLQEVREFLAKGTSERLERLTSYISSKTPDVNDIMKSGISLIDALQCFSDYGICSLNELEEAFKSGIIRNRSLIEKLKKHFFPDEVVRHTYSDMNVLAVKVVHMISPYCDLSVVAGSLRRKSPMVKDIDIVVVNGDSQKIYDLIKSENYKVIYGGEVKIHFMIPFFNTGESVACDLIFTNKESFPAALVYLTGCGEFNVAMRAFAKSHGMTLNEHALKSQNGNIILALNEMDLFSKIGVKWVEPELRVSSASVVPM